VRPDVLDRIDVIAFAALGIDASECGTVGGVEHLPIDFAAQRHPDALAVGRYPEAVGVLADVLAPNDGVGGEIDRDELVVTM
jgi:hypothetical protein